MLLLRLQRKIIGMIRLRKIIRAQNGNKLRIVETTWTWIITIGCEWVETMRRGEFWRLVRLGASKPPRATLKRTGMTYRRPARARESHHRIPLLRGLPSVRESCDSRMADILSEAILQDHSPSARATTLARWLTLKALQRRWWLKRTTSNETSSTGAIATSPSCAKSVTLSSSLSSKRRRAAPMINHTRLLNLSLKVRSNRSWTRLRTRSR